MKRILVWDLPVRLFHWILAGSFIVAFLISNTADDESPLFVVHMLLGAVMAFMIVLRLLWGLVGTRWARFNSFSASPKELLAYVGGVFGGHEKRYTGHNPGDGFAAILMFVLIIGLAVTGVMMGNGSEGVEELHEILAWSMVVVVGVHLAGIAWYTLRHREAIALSMVDGKKLADPAGAIQSARPVIALVFLALTGLWAFGLVNGYDGATGQVTLPLSGQTLQVAEGAEHEGREATEGNGREHHEHDEHEDDD